MIDRSGPGVVGDGGVCGHVGGVLVRIVIRSGAAVTLRTRGVGAG